jgi:hypothetical protein
MSVDYPTLDEAQEKRIAAVHGGFLYQHLFAVACLLKAKASNVRSVVIERDEDVEIVLADTRIYVQVKTRSAPLIPSDLGTALDRFQLLREQHKQGLRQGTPLFVVASNQPPGPKLGTQIKQGELGEDVQFIQPGQARPAELACLPDCWTDLSNAVTECVKLAETIPHGVLVPESLVWKLAGKVQAAATGHQNLGGYTFHSESLPALFEQLLTQLQRLPALQTHYPRRLTSLHSSTVSAFGSSAASPVRAKHPGVLRPQCIPRNRVSTSTHVRPRAQLSHDPW